MPLSWSAHFDLFPSLAKGIDPDRESLPRPTDFPVGERGEISLPSPLDENFIFCHLTLAPDEVAKGFNRYSVRADYFDNLPDFLSPKIGMQCSAAMKAHLETEFPDAAYFHPLELTHAETGQTAPAPYYTIVPRYYLYTKAVLRKRHDLPRAPGDCSIPQHVTHIHAIDGAMEHFSQVPILDGIGFSRDVFVSLKRAGFTGLDEVEFGKEYSDEKDTIGHAYSKS
ncbi:hypothetical protein [Algirhabdus cladophorae]|uniref:hypothetical protein n=1 Tax=Algirhabdus cladophorae TaxID=3377108 RepID=UPI003B84527F